MKARGDVEVAIEHYQRGEPVQAALLAAGGVAKSVFYRAIRARGLIQGRRTPFPVEQRRARDLFIRAARAARERAANPEPRRAATRKWWALHREEIAEVRRNKYAANPEPQKRSSRDYAATHRGEAIARWRQWRAAHPEQASELSRRRAALIRGATVTTLTATEWLRILETHEYRCAYCGSGTAKLEQDHVIPLSRGGTHEASNVVPACRTCNSSKSAKTPEEWFAVTRADALHTASR